ncbi:unnamed protein product, partial [Onchocerca ochengi]|uniref:Uncharacterized protein n=1 Tax=Onchocerca ochengi TaxID=42157 RepID=A0A182ETY9_ONCOC
RKKKDVINVS